MARKGEAIYKRKYGRYEARFIKGYSNGKADYIYVYGKSYMEVKKKRQLTIETYKDKVIRENNYSLNKIFDEFINNKRNKVKESSLSTYIFIINNHLRPEFGNLKINNLNTNLINKFIDCELDKYTFNVVHEVATLFKQILKINNINIDFIIPPKKRKNIDYFSVSETNTLKEKCLTYSDRIKFSIILTLYTGIRIGELCALKKENFNLEDRQLIINKTLIRIKNTSNSGNKTKVICQSAKTKDSVRIIPIADILIPYIKLYLEDIEDDDFFLTGKKSYIEPRVYYNKYLKILDSLKLKKHNFHSLRHTFATYAIEKKMDVKALSEVLGHANISITLNLYVHPSIDYKRKCINNIFN